MKLDDPIHGTALQSLGLHPAAEPALFVVAQKITDRGELATGLNHTDQSLPHQILGILEVLLDDGLLLRGVVLERDDNCYIHGALLEVNAALWCPAVLLHVEKGSVIAVDVSLLPLLGLNLREACAQEDCANT